MKRTILAAATLAFLSASAFVNADTNPRTIDPSIFPQSSFVGSGQPTGPLTVVTGTHTIDSRIFPKGFTGSTRPTGPLTVLIQSEEQNTRAAALK